MNEYDYDIEWMWQMCTMITWHEWNDEWMMMTWVLNDKLIKLCKLKCYMRWNATSESGNDWYNDTIIGKLRVCSEWYKIILWNVFLF